MTRAEIQHHLRWDISHPFVCPETMSAAKVYYVQYEWANTMGRLIAPERLALYCGRYAYPHNNEPSPVLKLDAQHTDRHRG